jgi:hypothetical protein
VFIAYTYGAVCLYLCVAIRISGAAHGNDPTWCGIGPVPAVILGWFGLCGKAMSP